MKFIECPFCGQEYHPAEIFIPKYIIGNPTHIVKDDTGKITNVILDNVDVEEKYICDKCSQEFTVIADIKYRIKTASKKLDFEKDYESSLK